MRMASTQSPKRGLTRVTVVALIGTPLPWPRWKAAGAVFEQAQVALALVEGVVFERGQRKIEVQAGQRLG
jgi:hypothetical protein